MPSKTISSESTGTLSGYRKPKWTSVLVMYLLYSAVLVRTLATGVIRPYLTAYLAFELTYLLLFSLVLWRPRLRAGWFHLYFFIQSVIILLLVSLHPDFDFVVVLFVLLCFQAAQTFTDPVRWAWIGLFILLTEGSLIVYLGVKGLAVGLTPMVGCIIFSAYVVTNQEVESARAQSQVMLNELQETHRQLEQRTNQVEELAAIEERNRLARELHDSVSQTMFSIILNIRSSQILLERNPDQIRPQLEQLQGLTQNALGQMRSLIAQLRPANNEQDPVNAQQEQPIL